MDFGSQAILKANCFLNRRQLTWKIVSYILYDVNFTFICRVDILIDDLNWVNMKPWAIFRYKRRTNVMCTTLLCSRGLPRPSRPCGPDTASRSPGAPSCTRTSRWVMLGSGWWGGWLSLNTSGPPQWSGHSQGSSAGHWLVLSIFWQFQTEQNSPGRNYKERACLWHLCLWYSHRCLRG